MKHENDEWSSTRTTMIFISTISWMLMLAISTLTILLCQKKKKNPPPRPPGPVTPKPNIKALPMKQQQPGKKQPLEPSTPGGGIKNDQHPHPSQHPKSPMNKSKDDQRKSARHVPDKMVAASLDKTQEDSKKTRTKSESKESGEKKDIGDGGGAAAGGGNGGTTPAPNKETKEGEKKNEEKKEEDKKVSEPPPLIVPDDKVQVLGNLEECIKEKKPNLLKDIEEMGSMHEHEKKVKDVPSLDPQRHVVINEKKCKLYTTNNEETKEDEAKEDDLI